MWLEFGSNITIQYIFSLFLSFNVSHLTIINVNALFVCRMDFSQLNQIEFNCNTNVTTIRFPDHLKNGCCFVFLFIFKKKSLKNLLFEIRIYPAESRFFVWHLMCHLLCFHFRSPFIYHCRFSEAFVNHPPSFGQIDNILFAVNLHAFCASFKPEVFRGMSFHLCACAKQNHRFVQHLAFINLLHDEYDGC